MSDELTRLQVIRDLGMGMIPVIAALGGVLLAHLLEGRRKRREADLEASRKTWWEHRARIIEVKNLAARLYERRFSDQYDHLRKPFLRDLEALHDLAGYWHEYDELAVSVPKYLSYLRNSYGKNKLVEDERENINDVYWGIDLDCSKILGRLLSPPGPWNEARIRRREKRDDLRWARWARKKWKKEGLTFTKGPDGRITVTKKEPGDQ
jgi:hypothetical protein